MTHRHIVSNLRSQFRVDSPRSISLVPSRIDSLASHVRASRARLRLGGWGAEFEIP